MAGGCLVVLWAQQREMVGVVEQATVLLVLVRWGRTTRVIFWHRRLSTSPATMP